MLGDLSTLPVVSEERNSIRVGHRLGASQSEFSHAIRRLEETIGVKLLIRSAEGVPDRCGRTASRGAAPQLSVARQPDRGNLHLGRMRLAAGAGGLQRVGHARHPLAGRLAAGSRPSRPAHRDRQRGSAVRSCRVPL
ncbi:LysR family transcriptional regulator [Ponticoccus alexandrii]|uniref:LysR family transcriptional regulator n=1 Tax=Ponticoccus alexandrii TaxID=1943633 RepID=A0ABX7F5Q1_9RHOB|nr:LysR family transcriptional regulator [Ponticoccus alexandrii]